MMSPYNNTLNSTVKQPQNMDQNSLITAHKRILGQGNVFTPVCHSAHRRDLPHYMLGYIPLPPFGQKPPIRTDNRRPRQTPPLDNTRCGQQAGGTHPTGMYTCFMDFVHEKFG